ncbi:uncharacterized protein LOC118448116, partial [Vespa mandarinia]|uniref:uncharacterized protein LOC118448116 n=1 Tax=Vespa mandarinia TaxID=7446 RepID=UPI00161D5570
MQSTKNKYVVRSLELRSLRSWFKHLPSIYKSFNYINNSEYYPYLCQKNQFNIGEIIQNDYINQQFITFYIKLILRKFFESWKIYAIYKLHRRKTLCEVNHMYRIKLKRNVFNILSKNIIKSNEYHNKIIQRRYFKLWKKYIEIIRYNKSLIKKYLQKSITIWKVYVLHRKEKNIFKKQLVDKVCKLYTSNLLHKYFIKWATIHNSTKVFKEQVQKIFCHYKKKMLEKYYLVWTAYYHAKIQNKFLKERADQQHCRKLLRRYLKKFVLYIHKVHIDRRTMKRTNTFYEFKIIVKIFNAWVEWYYQFSRICNIMTKIQQIIENKMKQKIFLYWKSYIFHKKCMRRKLFLCLTKYHKKISTNAFNKLQDYVLYKKRKQTQMLSLSTRAVTIIVKIQNMYIEKWKKKLNIHMQEKRRIFLATELYNNNIFKQYLFLWKKFSQQYKLKLLQKKKLDERASYFVLNKYIMIWKLKCEDNYKIYKKEKLILFVIHKSIQKKYLMFWKKYIAKKIDKKRDIEYAKNINKKFLLQEGLREILRNSLFTMQFHYESRIKYTTLKLVGDFEILSKYFDRWLSIVYLKEKLEFP